MTGREATAEVFWAAFRTLPKAGREAVIVDHPLRATLACGALARGKAGDGHTRPERLARAA